MKIQRSKCGVWMLRSDPGKSYVRYIAETAMRSLGHDVNDFRLRDRVIAAIALSRFDETLDRVWEMGRQSREQKPEAEQ